MGGMISPRPSLAVARYHLLAGLRTGQGIFAVTLFVAAFPLVVRAPFLVSDSELTTVDPVFLLREGGQNVSVVLILHLLLLLGAAGVVAARRTHPDGREPADLLETAPITPFGRFFGDMLGVLACMLVIHIFTLPILVMAFIFSAVDASVFWWYEVLVLALMILMAAGVSWKRRMSGPVGRAKAAGVVALLMTLVIITFAGTTRWPPFRDAVASYIAEPSPLRRSELAREVMSPVLLTVLLAAIYIGFLAYFALRSKRLIERRQEVPS